MNDLNPSYVDARDDIMKYIPNHVRRVLDVGCSVGLLGRNIKDKCNAEVTGIEINEKMARIAEKDLDRVIIGDLEEISLSDHFKPDYFDCIILADILEHLKDPWTLLRTLTSFLCEEGLVISSIPNVRHYTTLFQLACRGNWPYRNRGIHDKSHLRFFALRNVKDLFHHSALTIIEIEEKYRLIEAPHRYNRFSKYFAFPLIRPLLVFQYIVLAKK